MPQLIIGVWALAAPSSFYETFPFGRAWVSALGPFDEHLVRDVGALFTALSVLLLIAAGVLERRLVQASLVAWLIYAIPHFVWHSTATGDFELTDNVLQLGALGLQLLLPLVLLGWSRRL